MTKSFSNKFKDDRKYFTIVFFIFILLLLSGIISPIIINYQRENWSNTLSQEISNIEKYVHSDFKKVENTLLKISKSVKSDLREVLVSENVSYGEFVKKINQDKYEAYSLEILAPNGKLIAWNSLIAIPQEEIFPLDYPIGETYFFKSDLITYLTVTDTIISESDIFYIISSLPFEKHYSLQNKYYQDINFPKQISIRYSVLAEMSYNSIEPSTRDGRKYSFALSNNKNNKIGQVTFTKPLLDYAINKTNNVIDLIQSLLVFLGIAFLGIGLRKEFSQLKSSLYKIFLLTLYLGSFRFLIYKVGFPANLLDNSLSDPSFFSSAFAGGIVRSPIELFITTIFFTILCITIYRYWTDFIFSTGAEIFKSRLTYFLLFLLPLALLFFLGLRGLGASLRSVIFDSTLRYFRDQEIISNVPTLLMNLNVLLLGFSVILILGVIILFLLSMLESVRKLPLKKSFFVLYFIFIGLGLLFNFLQREPLITYSLQIVFTTFIFALAFHIYFGIKKSRYVFIYMTLCGSVISILLLNLFNLELEKESLKTVAAEINRPNDSFIRFMISEVLLNSKNNEKVLAAFTHQSKNYNADAYILWSQSSFQREALKTTISFIDKSGNILGQFWTGDNKIEQDVKTTIGVIKSDPIIFESKNSTKTNIKILTGITPISIQNENIGFISVSVRWDPGLPDFSSTPEFLKSAGGQINSVLDFELLKIFELSDSKLVKVYGDIYPSRDQIIPIINSDFSGNDDTWLILNLNEEKYLTYVLKHESDNILNITSVSLLEKKFSWNLFNFFKIFIIHIVFILCLFAILFVRDIKNFRYTFRFQLTIAFLIISLIPLVVLALYNRQVVEKRTDEAILNELNMREKYIENYIKAKLNSNSKTGLSELFESANKDLGISFAVYDNTLQIFNSKDQYYKAGIFAERIPPDIYYNLNYLSFREFSTKEKIEQYFYNSFYKKFSINEKNYILAVNDLFNEVKLTFSASDLDVLLFGIYSFAAFIIILLSAFLANKISSPIRKLTKATVSVAQGDLNIVIQNKEKGELKDLLDGFNSMTNELKKNQSELAELEREAAWKEMAKQVAHEIKNPLTPMKLSIQQMIASFKNKNSSFEEVFEKLSSTVLNQIESLSSIASEFSRFAKMPSYKMEEVDLTEVIKDTINLFTDEAIKIQLDSPENVPKLNADSAHVRRLIINLIRNSIQADAKQIKLSIIIEKDACVLFVQDNGKGIPPEIRDKIFEQNFTTKSAGMGIGLKLARRFMDGIGGSIVLIENDKPGTAFKIVFPLLQK